MSTLSGGPGLVKDGLILYLDAANTKCYPGTGTTWTDLSGQGNDGTLVGPVSFETSPSRFDTNATLVTELNQIHCNLITFADTSEYTMDFFIKMRSGWISGGPFQSLTGYNGTNPWLSIRPSGSVDWYISWRMVGGSYIYSTVITNLDISNVWLNLTFVITADRNYALYINGVYNQTVLLTTSYFYLQRLASGYNSDGNYYVLQGSLATVRMYTKALTASEVLQNYNALKGRFVL